jgi:hypothetical protein
MTKYDDARRGMIDRRRTAQPPRGRRVPEIIDGEVVAVEVHDDDPRTKVGPVTPDGAELQDSLDQIERLAAELKEIAEVITPAPNFGRRPASAAQVRFDQMRAEQQLRHGGARQAGNGARSEQAGAGTARPHPATAEAGRDVGDPFAAWNGPTTTGRSVIQEPLPPEPKRRADEDLIFGALEVDARHEDSTRPANAGPAVTGPAATGPARTGPVDLKSDEATQEIRPDRRTLNPVTTAMPVAELGVPGPAAANAKLTAPAGRPAGESRRPSGRSTARRGRYTAIIIGALVLAVPAFAIGAVQPWSASVRTPDKLSIAAGDQNEAPSTAVDPVPVSPSLSASPSPTPSAAYVAPIAPKMVTAGEPGEKAQPPLPKNPLPGLAVSARANDTRPTAGETVTFKLLWKDGSGRFAGSTQQWGDRSPTAGSISIRKCTGGAPASNGVIEATHSFREAGKYLVRLSVTTYTCDGRTETKTVPVTIVVGPKPSPSPSPTPSPSESPKPGE